MQRIEEIKNYLTRLRENKKQYCKRTSGKGINGKLGLSFEFKIRIKTCNQVDRLGIVKYFLISANNIT